MDGLTFWFLWFSMSGWVKGGGPCQNTLVFTSDFPLDRWHVKVKEWMKNVWVRTFLSPEMGFRHFSLFGWVEGGIPKWFHSQQVTCEGLNSEWRTSVDILKSIDGWLDWCLGFYAFSEGLGENTQALTKFPNSQVQYKICESFEVNHKLLGTL